MTVEHFRSQVAPSLPDQPGVYRFADKEGEVLYVGKAKSIRKRVQSYFNKASWPSARVALLARRTTRILFTVVHTEHDALLLENSFIKKHQPRYNIQLKDDKSFPYICIKNEPFPRIFLTRRRISDGSEYLGPFTSVKHMKKVLHELQTIYPLRTCNLNLSDRNISQGKFKVCLEYHLGNCLGPCEGKQSAEDYDTSVAQIRDILRGRTGAVIRGLKAEIKDRASRLEFEKAETAKTRIALLEEFESTSTVVSPRINDVDVFGFAEIEGRHFINYFRMAHGTIVLAHVTEVKRKLQEGPSELLAFAIHEIRNRFSSTSTEVLVPFKIDYPNPEVRTTVPQRGEKKWLVELSNRNAQEYASTEASSRKKKAGAHSVLEVLQKDLRLPAYPSRIECIDNSNLHGTNPVSALVVFVDGKPAKSHYRHFNIRTVQGSNDFATMQEVVQRRFSGMDKDQPLPQLLLIDGGKGQVRAAYEALEQLKLDKKITVAGIAKKLEELYIAKDSLPLHISKRSPSLKLLQRLRDEAHRFAVSFHRLKRLRKVVSTELTSIKGIGSQTAQVLLRKFRSVSRIRTATLAELEQAVGSSKASKVFEHFSEAALK